MHPGPKRLIEYETRDGKVPFDEWLKDLKDRKGKAIIISRLDRLQETGNPGDCKAVGQGVYELKVRFGPGYRVYYGEDGDAIVILLCGGDKSSQQKDILRAKSYWKNYRRFQ